MGIDRVRFRGTSRSALLRPAFFYVGLFTLFVIALISFTTDHSSGLHEKTIIHGNRPSLNGNEDLSETKEEDAEVELVDSNGWSFNVGRDARNYGLSEEQCNVAFPKLYHEIDRAVAFRQGNEIQEEEVETGWRGDGIARCMIYNNALYIIEARGITDKNHRPRAMATLHAINRAINAYPGPMPNVEFTFTVHDSAAWGNGPHTTFSYSRLPEEESLWLMPDFGFWGWPDVGMRSYSELQSLIGFEEEEFIDKIPQLVWRGSVTVGYEGVREALVAHTKDQPWSDVRTLDWSNHTNIAENIIGMNDHCAYMFVAQTEGNTYSGRLKYLLNCQSVIVSHQLKFLEHFTHLLVDEGKHQNYVKVKYDFSDLKQTMEKFLLPNNAEEGHRIAGNARTIFRDRYLTPAAEACYWRQLFRGWSSVQGFVPEFWKEEEVQKGDKIVKKTKPRGVPFEAFSIMEEVEWTLPTKPRKMCTYDANGNYT